MASKGKTVDRADIKMSSPQMESEITKLRKDNAHMKKTLDELSESENNRLLLERILALETLREQNSQQILSKDQEITSLRQQLRLGSAEVVASLQAQLNEQRVETEMRERLFQSLKRETEEVKNQLAAVSAKCQDVEHKDGPLKSGTTDGQSVIQEHLKDALEKNQQWLAYDQQREAYVKAVLERTHHLELQLNQTKKALLEKDKEAASEVKERVAHGRRQLRQMEQQYKERQQEVAEMRQQLQAERLRGKKALQEQRRHSGQHLEHLFSELDAVNSRLDEERSKSAELLQQVSLLQKSLLNLHEEKNRMSLLEQQIQMSAKDLEDEKRENQHLQRQLRKLLKELQRAKDKVARLEYEKMQGGSPFTSLEKNSKESQQRLTSPTSVHDLLDESFLECPNCRAQYPTSCHRELLVHIDQCLD